MKASPRVAHERRAVAPRRRRNHEPRPLPFDAAKLTGLSERLIRSLVGYDMESRVKTWVTVARAGVPRADEHEAEQRQDTGALLPGLPSKVGARRAMLLSVLVMAGFLLLAPHVARAATPKHGLDAALIDRLTGAKGQMDEKEGVFKVSVPRNDLQPTVAGMKLPTSMGLTAWAAFEPADSHTMVMGDIVLAEDQVNPVMSAALYAGLEVTGLHNHFLWETPRVMFMHIGGTGDQRALATAVGKVFAKMKETAGGKGETPTARIDPRSRRSTPPSSTPPSA
jgi:uncharacterized protein DUF1259